jgi:hypothetical protein
VTERVAYVRGNPRALFNAVTAGGVQKSKDKYTVGLATVSYSAGTSTNKPTIKVSDSVSSTKVIVLA